VRRRAWSASRCASWVRRATGTRRDGQTIPKSVSFYLFKYIEGDTDDHDDEVEEARWIALEDAQSELSHSAEREMVARAVAFLEADRKDR